MNQFERTELLIGTEAVEKLKESKVIVYGIGGVGSFAVEGLVRAGIGHIIIVDFDKVDVTNINRQLEATHSTIGKNKIDVMKDRILDINPDVVVEKYLPSEIEGGETSIIDGSVTYIVDAIDTMTAKLKIIEKANEQNVPIISATSAGNKLNPTMFEVADIYKTSVCPVCKKLRKELKQKGIKKLKVVYSKEMPHELHITEEIQGKTIGSISFVPSVAGLIIASEVVKDIIRKISLKHLKTKN